MFHLHLKKSYFISARKLFSRHSLAALPWQEVRILQPLSKTGIVDLDALVLTRFVDLLQMKSGSALVLVLLCCPPRRRVRAIL